MQILKELGFVESPDEWDRLYGVDFHKEINGKYVGVQIKPPTFSSTTAYSGKGQVRSQHRIFEAKFGGKVFIIIKNSDIKNPEIIEKIKQEIQRLSKDKN